MTLLPGCGLSAAEPRVSLERLKADLVLQTSLKTPRTIHAGSLVAVDIVLRNLSQDTSYPILLPGDGSEAGMRNPHVYFTATIDTGRGKVKAVPQARYARCGNRNPYSDRDIYTLKPGEAIPVKGGLTSPSTMLEFQEAGRVRLLVHYAYRGFAHEGFDENAIAASNLPEEYLIEARKRAEQMSAITDHMKDLPVFELVSQPLEFDVVRPLDLVLSVKSALRVKEPSKMSDLFDLKLINRSRQSFEISSPALSTGTYLVFESNGVYGGWRPMLGRRRDTDGGKTLLAPGKAVALLGESTFANGTDGTWEYPIPDTVKVRAMLYAPRHDPPTALLSNWVEIKARTVSETEKTLEFFIAELASPSEPILYSKWIAIVLLTGFLAWRWLRRWVLREKLA